jgi:hypothetical protein
MKTGMIEPLAGNLEIVAIQILDWCTTIYYDE